MYTDLFKTFHWGKYVPLRHSSPFFHWGGGCPTWHAPLPRWCEEGVWLCLADVRRVCDFVWQHLSFLFQKRTDGENRKCWLMGWIIVLMERHRQQHSSLVIFHYLSVHPSSCSGLFACLIAAASQAFFASLISILVQQFQELSEFFMFYFCSSEWTCSR